MVGAADSFEALTDRLYEAALAPSLWSGLLDDIRRHFGAEECGLLRFPDRRPPEVLSSYFCPDSVDGFRTTAWKSSPSIALAMSRPPGQLVALGKGVPAALLERDLAMQMLFSEGIKHCLGYLTPSGDGGRLGLLLGRGAASGPLAEEKLSELAQLCGHLRRLRSIAVGAADGEAKAITQALNQIRVPAAAITEDRRVLAVNDTFENSYAFLTTGATGRIMLGDADDNALFGREFDRLVRSDRPAAATIVTGTHGEGPIRILRLLSVRGAAADILRDARVVVTVSDSPAAPAEELAGLLGLTPAEARVARHMVVGAPLREIARSTGVTIHTVRTHLQSIMAKTGTRRQLDLVQLLSRI